jgi:hypothetical protein
MTAPEDLGLPALEPFSNAGQRIAESRWLTEDDRAWMTSELARLQAEYARLDFSRYRQASSTVTPTSVTSSATSTGTRWSST